MAARSFYVMCRVIQITCLLCWNACWLCFLRAKSIIWRIRIKKCIGTEKIGLLSISGPMPHIQSRIARQIIIDIFTYLFLYTSTRLHKSFLHFFFILSKIVMQLLPIFHNMKNKNNNRRSRQSKFYMRKIIYLVIKFA